MFEEVSYLKIMNTQLKANQISNKKPVALFLYVIKAFDSVWHKGLLYKLEILQCSRYLIHVIKNFLEARSLTVQI